MFRRVYRDDVLSRLSDNEVNLLIRKKILASDDPEKAAVIGAMTKAMAFSFQAQNEMGLHTYEKIDTEIAPAMIAKLTPYVTIPK